MAEFLDQVIKRFNGEMAVIQPRPQARFETPVVEDLDRNSSDENENTLESHASEIPAASTPNEQNESMHISPSRETTPAHQPINSPTPSLEVKERREVNNIEHRRIVVERVVEAREYDARSAPLSPASSDHESVISESPISSKDVGNDKLDLVESEMNQSPTHVDDYSSHLQTDGSEVESEGYDDRQQLRNPSMVEEQESGFRARKDQHLSEGVVDGPLYPREQIDDSVFELDTPEANGAHTQEEQTVTINIGRIEIGQIKPQPEPVKAHVVARAKPAMSLEQYLRARAGDPS